MSRLFDTFWPPHFTMRFLSRSRVSASALPQSAYIFTARLVRYIAQTYMHLIPPGDYIHAIFMLVSDVILM